MSTPEHEAPASGSPADWPQPWGIQVCTCVKELKGTWADLPAFRVCLAGTGAHLHAQRECLRCHGTGIVPRPDQSMPPPEPPGKVSTVGPGNYRTIQEAEEAMLADQRREPPAYYASVGSEKDGRPFRYEAGAPSLHEACNLLYMIRANAPAAAGPASAPSSIYQRNAALRDRLASMTTEAMKERGERIIAEGKWKKEREAAAHEMSERIIAEGERIIADGERDGMTSEIAALKAEAHKLRETAAKKADPKPARPVTGCFPDEIMHPESDIRILEKAIKDRDTLKAEADKIHATAQREAHQAAMAMKACQGLLQQTKGERADLRNALEALLAEARQHITCFACALAARAHSPGCPVATAELLLAEKTT